MEADRRRPRSRQGLFPPNASAGRSLRRAGGGTAAITTDASIDSPPERVTPRTAPPSIRILRTGAAIFTSPPARRIASRARSAQKGPSASAGAPSEAPASPGPNASHITRRSSSPLPSPAGMLSTAPEKGSQNHSRSEAPCPRRSSICSTVSPAFFDSAAGDSTAGGPSFSTRRRPRAIDKRAARRGPRQRRSASSEAGAPPRAGNESRSFRTPPRAAPSASR